MHSDHIIKDIKVIGVEKPQKGKFQQHFEYVIRVTYNDGYEHLIFRRYSMLFDFHAVLKEVIKDSYNSVIVLPELPVARFQHVGRKFLRLGMNKELKQMTEFCQKIILLPKFISEKDIILKFFDQLGTDIAHAEAYQEESQKGELPKEPTPCGAESYNLGSNGDVGTYNDNQYRSVADFEASGTGELSVTCGELVTVIEKNSSGWWLVSNSSGATGFTPATFLESLEEKGDTPEEEWVDVRGPDNIYTAVKDYEAKCPDEISFKTGEELEVLSMSNFGWWKVRRRNEVGLSPASSLTRKIASEPSGSHYEDPMNEFRKSVLNISKKSSTREAPPRRSRSSTRSFEYDEINDPDHCYSTLHYPDQVEVNSVQKDRSAKYTKVIPKHLRPKEENNDNNESGYINVPVIKHGIPHYYGASDDNKTEAINVYVVRKAYQGYGLDLQEGETVQVISVMPDGCHWKIATLKPPFKDGLIPSDHLCPELPNQLEETPPPPVPKWETVFIDNKEPGDNREQRENREPVRVLPRFTQPPSLKRPVPKPRAGHKSPTVRPKGISLVALDNYIPPQGQDILAFQKGDVGRLIKKEVESGWCYIELNGFEGWVPNTYWREAKDMDERKNPSSITQSKSMDRSQWFYGKMSRQQCEDLFQKSGEHLDFVIRESVQRVGSYVLSIKFNDKIHHFPIEKLQSGKLVIGKLNFDQLSEIVAHYTIHPLFYTDNRQPVSIGKPLARI